MTTFSLTMVLMAARKEPQQKKITKTSDHGPYFQRNLFHRRGFWNLCKPFSVTFVKQQAILVKLI